MKRAEMSAMVWRIAAVGAVTVACDGGHLGPTPPAGDDVAMRDLGPAGALDHPPIQGTSSAARSGVQRLSVSQLAASFPVLFGADKAGGPITWRVTAQKSGFDVYRGTLGAPDYINVTEDNREPSALYAKFLDDAARSACDQALDADATRTDKAARVLLRAVAPTDTVATAPAAVDENLRYLRVRFHALRVPVGDDAPIAPYRALFSAAVAGSTATSPTLRVRDGWRAVCVALTSAAELNLY